MLSILLFTITLAWLLLGMIVCALLLLVLLFLLILCYALASALGDAVLP